VRNQKQETAEKQGSYDEATFVIFMCIRKTSCKCRLNYFAETPQNPQKIVP